LNTSAAPLPRLRRYGVKKLLENGIKQICSGMR
jgi:hypothetical protein